MEELQPYCSKCGEQLKPGEVIYPDLRKWAREYDEAKVRGLPLPICPGLGVSTCCNVPVIHSPSPEIEIPLLAPGITRVETPNFGAMLKLCYAIGKSPFSIEAYLRLDIVPSLFGPKVYFIDVKAKRFKDKIKEIMPTISAPMIEREIE